MPDSSSPSSNPSGQSLPSGAQLQEFVIERVLGSGGFGITYLARDSRLVRQVVIKENLPAQFCWRDTTSLTVQPRHSSGEDLDNFQYSLDSFEKEAATLASLDHPGIVKVLRSFEANGTAYFVMPFVEGVTFDEVMREREAQQRPFTEVELVALLDKVLAALGYLHERGIYHRDIKPGNLLITASGDPVLIDFGAARQRLSERSLTVIESPGYTPFEQMQSRGKVGPWSDLYAFGGTLYKAITGETPAKATDRAFDDPVMPLEGRADLAGQYSNVFLGSIDRAMHPQVNGRTQNASQWRDLLEPKKYGNTPVPTPVGDFKPPPFEPAVESRVPQSSTVKSTDVIWLWGGVGALALILVGFAVVLSSSRRSDREPDELTSVVFSPPEQTSPSINPLPPNLPSEYVAKSVRLSQGSVGEVYEVKLPGEVVMKFCYCPAGSFLMGSPKSEKGRGDDEDQVGGGISQGFWMGQTEVTQKQWTAVIGSNPSSFKGDDLPLETVSWEDAQTFIRHVNQTVPLPEGWSFALPSEAQWEYACRAGTETVFAFGDSLSSLWANFDGNVPYGTGMIGPNLEKTSEVASYKANGWGLYDMHGNVWEWCADWYGEKLLGGADPVGASTGSHRVFRGGCWRGSAGDCRAANRHWDSPSRQFSFLGFRVAAVPARPTTSVEEDEPATPSLPVNDAKSPEAAPSLSRNAYTRYPWRTDIIATVFWVGNPPTSPWDPNWLANYGGVDNPDPAERTEAYTPRAFTPGLNPFYVALPYDDCLNKEEHKPEAAKMIPWFRSSFVKEGRSVLRGTWLAIRFGSRVCYAQWENCGPFGSDDSPYVFGTARPQNQQDNGSGINVSPAVRDFLRMPNAAKVDWRFVDVNEIPAGPWTKHGRNNHFVRIKELRGRR